MATLNLNYFQRLTQERENLHKRKKNRTHAKQTSSPCDPTFCVRQTPSQADETSKMQNEKAFSWKIWCYDGLLRNTSLFGNSLIQTPFKVNLIASLVRTFIPPRLLQQSKFPWMSQLNGSDKIQRKESANVLCWEFYEPFSVSRKTLFSKWNARCFTKWITVLLFYIDSYSPIHCVQTKIRWVRNISLGHFQIRTSR